MIQQQQQQQQHPQKTQRFRTRSIIVIKLKENWIYKCKQWSYLS